MLDELNSCASVVQFLIQNSGISLQGCFISFVDPHLLGYVAELALLQGRPEPFFRLAAAHAFMHTYINRVDRSLFFLLYEDPQFLAIEQQGIFQLANRQFAALQISSNRNGEILRQIQLQSSVTGLRDIIETLFFEPDLPLPKMKRQTVGIHCQSPFQQMLALLKFSPLQKPQWVQPQLLALQELLKGELDRVGPDLKNQTSAYRCMQITRYCGHSITSENWQNFILRDFKSHNMIVLLLALANNLVSIMRLIIESMDDPFLRAIEFALRANIFRNIILGLEEKMGFLWAHYDQLCEQLLRRKIGGQWGFWMPAMTIWTSSMSHLHTSVWSIQSYVMAKLREHNTNESLCSKAQHMPSIYMKLKSQVEIEMYSSVKRQQAYAVCEGKVSVEQFFQDDLELYEILAKEFLEYMVDISINEFSVHYCGHSRHSITRQNSYKQFHQSVVSDSRDYYTFLKDTLAECTPQQLRMSLLKELAKEDLHYIQNRFAKPVDVAAIVKDYNLMAKEIIEADPAYSVFGEEELDKYCLNIDFTGKDNLLQYFGKKEAIEPDCSRKLTSFYNFQKIHDDAWILNMVSEHKMQEKDESEDASEKYISDDDESMTIKEPRISQKFTPMDHPLASSEEMAREETDTLKPGLSKDTCEIDSEEESKQPLQG